MAINRSNWNKLFEKSSFPSFPCPQCATGKVKLHPNSLSIVEPAFSKAMHKHRDFEADWVAQRFVAKLVCDEGDCGEVVIMAGDTEVVEAYIDEENYSGPVELDALRPRSVFPAPPLFKIPETVPHDVVHQLRLAFQLFWTDEPSCIARLRTSIELMLDQQKVPTTQLDQKTGKTSRINLYNRIKAFENQSTGADAADSLQALRNVGNFGTHGDFVSAEALFDAIDVLEDVLLGVYEKKSIKAKAKKLADMK